jgi:hypothetical protein
MNKFLIIGLLFISGCTHTVPVTAIFPEAPEILKEECPVLFTLPENAKLSDILRTDVKNMTLYHECKLKSAQWKQWYDAQRTLFNKATKR